MKSLYAVNLVIFVLVFSCLTDPLFIQSSIGAVPKGGTTPFKPYYALVLKWGSEGSGNGQFNSPRGIAVDSSTHEIYVADYGNHRIQKFKLSNPCPDNTKEIKPGICFVKSWGNNEKVDAGQLSYPYGVAVDASTHEVYVSNSGGNNIKKFSSDGDFIKSWGNRGHEDGEFEGLKSIAVDSSTHEVFVADSGNHRFQKFSSNGHFLTSFDHKEYASPPLIPRGIAVDTNSHEIYTTGDERSIQKFTSDGVFTDHLGNNLFIGHPTDVTVDSKGNIYGSDIAVKARILKFTNTGTLLVNFASPSGDGQFTAPESIAVDTSGHLFLTDSNYNSVFVFEWKTPYPTVQIPK